MPEISVRAAEPGDAEAIHQILRCPGVVANTLQLPWRSLEYTRERFAAHANEHSLVAVVDGRVVGHLGLHIVENPRRRDVGDFGMAIHE